MRFFINAADGRKARKGSKRRPSRKRSKAPARRERAMARKRRARKHPPRRHTRKRAHSRRRNPFAANPPRRRHSGRRRSFRRNPGIVPMLMEGVKGGVAVTAGRVAVRTVPGLFKLPVDGATGLLAQAAVGVAIGWVADRFGGREIGKYVLAGAFSAPISGAISKALPAPGTSGNRFVDAVSGALAGEEMGSYPASLGSYPGDSSATGVLSGEEMGEDFSMSGDDDDD